MKLIYLSSIRLPTKNAHGFQIMNMCSAFAKQGASVELLVPTRKNLLTEDPFEFYALPKNFVYRKIKSVDLYSWRIPERISSLIHTLSFLISARLYLWKNGFDALYTRERLASLFFSEYIYEVHMPEQLRTYIFRPKKIIVLNRHIKDELMKRGYKNDQIIIEPDAVDLSKFREMSKRTARESLGLPIDPKIILYWGNFKKWKGVDTLAKASRLLREFYVVIIGATKESDLERISLIAKDQSNTKIMGFRDQSELPSYLEAADILVLPNTKDDENSRLYTSPLKLFEYMAAKRPIIASDLPSIREVLDENRAIFFEPDNYEDLAEKIKHAFKDQDHLDLIADNARKLAEQHTWDARAADILNFINA